MKNGLIVYVAGQVPENWSEEMENDLKKNAMGAEAVEFITTRSGHFDIDDAWHALTVRGMGRIVCTTAYFDETGRLCFTGREMRLSG